MTTAYAPAGTRLSAAARRTLIVAINLLATVHVVWFYINRVPSYLHLLQYEVGHERMPFQGRLFMQYPLLWAQHSHSLNRWASHLASMGALFPAGIHPEGIVEAVIDFVAVVVAGLVARNLYCLYSERQILRPLVYPVMLYMIVVSYCLQTIHFFRYVYDLPSLGLFSCGLYLIARRKSVLLLGAVFVVATTNRETSLFLLPLFALSCCVEGNRLVRQRVLRPRNILTLTTLSLFWMAWHVWTTHRFAALVSETEPRLIPNIATMLFAWTWPQLAGVAGYLLPLLLVDRRRIRSVELRSWMWILPVWFVFMLFFGLLVEIRLFGELIPMLACAGVLCLEETLIAKLAQVRSYEMA